MEGEGEGDGGEGEGDGEGEGKGDGEGEGRKLNCDHIHVFPVVMTFILHILTFEKYPTIWQPCLSTSVRMLWSRNSCSGSRSCDHSLQTLI